MTNIQQRIAAAQALENIIDPELGVDIVSLGLIYDLEVVDHTCTVTMTLTIMGCPLSDLLDSQIRQEILSVDGIDECVIELVWQPVWDMSMMTRVCRLALGLHF